MEMYINGNRIKSPNNPSGFKHAYFEISDGGRTADGTMQADRIAQKEKFFLQYDSISHTELQNILNLIYFTPDKFFTFQFNDKDGTHEFEVYRGEISQVLHRGSEVGGWYYKDFSFNLIER